MKGLQKYSGSFLLALCLHGGVMSLFVVSALFHSATEEKIVQKTPEIIEASILDDAQVTAKAAELKQAEQNKQRAQKHQQDKIAEQLKQEKRRLQQAKKKRLNEERKAREYAAQQKQKAQQAAAKLKAIQQKAALAKQKHQETEKKRALEKKRQQDAERMAIEKRKAEAAKKQAERKAAEKQAKIMAEKKRVAAEKQRQLAAQKKAIADKIRAEKARIARKATADAKALIHRKVTQNWNQPNSIAGKLACTIKVDLIPSGDVMTVHVVKSSGNALFDNSAERAVYKASPLPVPKDPDVFKQFRSFTFVFSPNQ